MYRNLVFKGGGIKIYASLGALKSLDECDGLLEGIDRVAGSSAGALLALMVSLGIGADEAIDFVRDLDFLKEEIVTSSQEKTVRFFKELGVYTGFIVRKSVSELIESKTGNPDITFAQLHEMGFKDLYVTGTNLNKKQLQIFSYEGTPDVRVIDAVQLSGSYPIYFIPRNIDGDLYLDGGLINNYPINIFDEEKYLPAGCKPGDDNPETFGVFIGSVNESFSIIENLDDVRNIIDPFNGMDEAILQEELAKLDYGIISDDINEINSILDLISVAFQITSSTRSVYHHFGNEVVIPLESNINALRFDLSDEDIESLLKNGKATTDEYIALHCDNFFQETNTCNLVEF